MRDVEQNWPLVLDGAILVECRHPFLEHLVCLMTVLSAGQLLAEFPEDSHQIGDTHHTFYPLWGGIGYDPLCLSDPLNSH